MVHPKTFTLPIFKFSQGWLEFFGGCTHETTFLAPLEHYLYRAEGLCIQRKVRYISISFVMPERQNEVSDETELRLEGPSAMETANCWEAHKGDIPPPLAVCDTTP